MKGPPFYTLGEIREMVERGVFGAKSFDACMTDAASGMRAMVAIGMGCAPERITRCAFVNVDDAMPGKVALEILFDPELTRGERAAFLRLLTTLASMLGSRPPIVPGEA